MGHDCVGLRLNYWLQAIPSTPGGVPSTSFRFGTWLNVLKPSWGCLGPSRLHLLKWMSSKVSSSNQRTGSRAVATHLPSSRIPQPIDRMDCLSWSLGISTNHGVPCKSQSLLSTPHPTLELEPLVRSTHHPPSHPPSGPISTSHLSSLRAETGRLRLRHQATSKDCDWQARSGLAMATKKCEKAKFEGFVEELRRTSRGWESSDEHLGSAPASEADCFSSEDW